MFALVFWPERSLPFAAGIRAARGSKRHAWAGASLVALLLATAVRAQSQAGFLTGLLETPDMPQLQLILANRPTAVVARRDGVATMTAPDSEVRLEARS